VLWQRVGDRHYGSEDDDGLTWEIIGDAFTATGAPWRLLGPDGDCRGFRTLRAAKHAAVEGPAGETEESVRWPTASD
jgi:hypothetical protein